MNPRRKATEEYILKHVDAVDPSKKNGDRFRKMFEGMSDQEFHTYMENIRDGKDVLYLYFANCVDKADIATFRDHAEKMGIELFERVKMWDEATQTYYLTPHKYFIAQWPVRRFSQFVDHKLSVAEGDSKLDLLTGQVTQSDRAGGISQVEIQTLYARGLQNTIVELLKYRGGDVTALSEFRRELEEQGKTTIARDTGSIARSAVVFDVFMSGMHIEANASGV